MNTTSTTTENTESKAETKLSRQKEMEKDRKVFVRRKVCWFCAKKIEPDWKDSNTYLWVVNEFGKISPSRITGVCPKHQRSVSRSIKRSRCIGLIKYTSNVMIQ